jgi:Fe(3+) dicitrate transport protein
MFYSQTSKAHVTPQPTKRYPMQMLCPTLLAVISPALTTLALAEDGLDSGQTAPVPYRSSITIVGNPADFIGLPGTANVLTEQELKRDNSGDINRVLRKMPGVYLREEDGFGLFPNISLRGVDVARAAKITLMEDGVLASPAPYSAPAAYFVPAIGRMNGVEVRKGSAQIRFGPQTTGGALNLLSVPIPEETSVYSKSSYGSDNSLRTHIYGGSTVDTSVGRIGALIDIYYSQSDGFKDIQQVNDPDYPGTDDSGFSQFEPVFKLAWEPKSSMYQRLEGKFSLTHTDANQSYLGLGEADFAEDPFRRYQASRFDNFTGDIMKGDIRYYLEPSDDWNISIVAYAHRMERDWFKLQSLQNIELGSGATISGLSLGEALSDPLGLEALKGEREATLRYRHNDRRYTARGISLDNSNFFTAGSVDHEVQAGIRYHWDSEYRLQQDIDYRQNDQGQIEDVDPVGDNGRAGHRFQETNAIAMYLEDDMRFGNWRVSGGIRLEYFDMAYENRPPVVPQNGTGQLALWSGGLGASYQIADNWAVYGDVFRGVSAPAPRAYIHDNVDPETSLGFEIGTRYQDYGAGDFQIDVAAFATQFSDLLVVDNIGGSGTGNSENAGDVMSIGIETGARVDTQTYWGLPMSNPWALALTLTSATLQGDASSTDPDSIFSGGEDGNQVPYIPPVVISLSTELNWQTFGFGISGQYQAKTYSSASNTEETISPDGTPDSSYGTTDAYFLLDIDAWYQITAGLKVFGGVNNALNQEYIATRHPAGPQAGRPLYAFLGVEAAF